MEWGTTDRRVQSADVTPNQRAQRDRQKRGTERGVSQLRRRQGPGPRNDLDGGRLPQLTLVHRHTHGGVTLDMLDRSKILADREFDVRDRYVVAQIDPLPGSVSDGTDALTEIFGRASVGPSRDLNVRYRGQGLECASTL